MEGKRSTQVRRHQGSKPDGRDSQRRGVSPRTRRPDAGMLAPYARPCCNKLSRSPSIATMTFIANPMESGQWLLTRNRSGPLRNPTLPYPILAPNSTPSYRSSRKPLHSHFAARSAAANCIKSYLWRRRPFMKWSSAASSPSLPADAALRGLGSGRSRSLGRSPETSLTHPQERCACWPGRRAAPIPARAVNSPTLTMDMCQKRATHANSMTGA